MNARIDKVNTFFFAFFCFELVVKLAGRGFVFYFRERFNWFDSGVVVVSAIDIILSNTAAAS